MAGSTGMAKQPDATATICEPGRHQNCLHTRAKDKAKGKPSP